MYSQARVCRTRTLQQGRQRTGRGSLRVDVQGCRLLWQNNMIPHSHLGEGFDAVALDGQGALLANDFALEATVHRVVLEHVRHVVAVDEGVVYGDQLHVVALRDDPVSLQQQISVAVPAQHGCHETQNMLRSIEYIVMIVGDELALSMGTFTLFAAYNAGMRRTGRRGGRCGRSLHARGPKHERLCSRTYISADHDSHA